MVEAAKRKVATEKLETLSVKQHKKNEGQNPE